MTYDEERNFVVDGFPSLELANEFARRWTRDSLEKLRGTSESKDELRRMWHMFGEDASVLGGEPRYAGSHDLDYFIEHPATPEECDWLEVKRLAGRA